MTVKASALLLDEKLLPYPAEMLRKVGRRRIYRVDETLGRPQPQRAYPWAFFAG